MEYFLKEWHSITDNVCIENLPEFYYKIPTVSSAHLGIEVLTQTSPESTNIGKLHDLNYIPTPIIDGIMVDKKATTNKDIGFGVDPDEMQLPIFQNILTGGMVVAGSRGLEDYPRKDLLTCFEQLPNGSAFAQELLLEHLAQIEQAVRHYKKVNSLPTSSDTVGFTKEDEAELFSTEESTNNPAQEQDNTHDITLQHQIKEDTISRRVVEEDDILRIGRESFIVVSLAEGQQPTHTVRNLLTDFPHFELKEGHTLIKAPRYIKHVGWRVVAQTLKRFFQCSFTSKSSSHINVKRIANGQEYNGTILSPHRNKYAKNAAFGTLKSVLQQLGIHEHDFWDAVRGEFIPEKVIVLAQDKYRGRIKNI